MSTARTDPPYIADERPMLEAWLDYHRATLAMKCDGLSAEQLRRRAVPPSPLSLLGLVRHMAEVERGWFRWMIDGEDAPLLYCSDADPHGDFDRVDDADPAEVFAAWHAECDRARELLAAAPNLDVRAARERGGQPISLRWIIVHVIEEYARHNGHADFLRERIDGVVGD
ncbi:MAG: DinB family protein [Chloroflexi bacterium]|nr:DinB family protein [Chloroflexota bacterium]